MEDRNNIVTNRYTVKGLFQNEKGEQCFGILKEEVQDNTSNKVESEE